MNAFVITSDASLDASDFERMISRAAERAVRIALQNKGADVHPGGSFMTNDEAMAYLGLSRPTLQRYRNNGVLPFSKVGRNIYYRREDVEALLERNFVANP